MTFSMWRAWLGAATIGLAAAMPVQASLVTFEDASPDLTAFGGSLSSGGYRFTDDNVGGFIGIDSAAAFDPASGGAAAAPANPSGQFLYMTNSAGVAMMSESGLGFYLNSFDVAFLAPIPQQGGVLPGVLTVALYDLMGANFATETFNLAAGAFGGDFPFQTQFLSSTALLSHADFSVCAFQSSGSCERFGLLPAQFALDNIDNLPEVTAIPEPGSAVLVLTALGLLVIRRRKTAAIPMASTTTRTTTAAGAVAT